MPLIPARASWKLKILKLVIECVKCASGKSSFSEFMTVPVKFGPSIAELKASIMAGTTVERSQQLLVNYEALG